MKRCGYLYEKIYDMDNLRLAHKNASKGKQHYKEVKMINANPDYYLKQIYLMLKNKTFKNSKYETFIKKEYNKERLIHKLPYYPDRIIHHAIMQIVEPIWKSSLIKDTYSSIKGRGIHKGVKRIKQFLRDKENTKYCLKLDISKFYPSIDNKILKQIIRKKIKDKGLLWLLDEIIDSTKGVPIGNYLSQYFGNLYLSGLDHFLKEQMHCKYYLRYCDDLVILSQSKDFLKDVLKEIQKFCKNLKLTIKSNWQIFPIEARGLDFLGYKFYHTHILLRKNIKKLFTKKIKLIKKKKIIKNPLNVIMSYVGWMTFANSKNLFNKYIKDIKLLEIIQKYCSKNSIQNPLRRVI